MIYFDYLRINDELNEYNDVFERNDLSESFDTEFFNFLAVLTTQDKKVSDNEIAYINKLTNRAMDRSIFEKYLRDSSLNKKSLNAIPSIISILLDIIFSKPEYSKDIYYTTANIIDLYKNAGLEIMAIDDSISQKELKLYTQYINNLTSKIKIRLDAVYDAILDDDDEYEPQEEPEEIGSLDVYMNELNSLVGLDSVKDEISSLVNLIEVRKLREERGFANMPMSFHMVFLGNPGTGKTTVARLLAKIYKELGLLSKGQLVEVDRSSLVAGFIGQTAIKTKEVCDSALGGILFIDEAYSLIYGKSDNDYGIEAIDTLLKEMEDNRENLIVIVAGYPEQMKDFINSNPGLKSRFSKYIIFDDYNSDELYQIFESIAIKNSYKIEDKAKDILIDFFNSVDNDEFGNARGVRNLFEKTVTNQARRIVNIKNITNEELITITEEDIF